MFSWRESYKRLFSNCGAGAGGCQPTGGEQSCRPLGTGPILQWQWSISLSSPICALDLKYCSLSHSFPSVCAMSCISNKSVFHTYLLFFFFSFSFVKIINDVIWKELTKWGAVHPPFLISSHSLPSIQPTHCLCLSLLPIQFWRSFLSGLPSAIYPGWPTAVESSYNLPCFPYLWASFPCLTKPLFIPYSLLQIILKEGRGWSWDLK